MPCETMDPVSRLAIPSVPGPVKLRRFRRSLKQLSPRKCTIAFAAATLPVVADAQTGTDIGRAPTLTIERYPESWSYLTDPTQRTGRWTEPFKYIPLSADGSTYLTTGLEVRSRYEGYANVRWGAARTMGLASLDALCRFPCGKAAPVRSTYHLRDRGRPPRHEACRRPAQICCRPSSRWRRMSRRRSRCGCPQVAS
jgi:hypothetical protein